MEGKIIGANLKFNQPLRRGGFSNYVYGLSLAMRQMANPRTVVRVFAHNFALIREASKLRSVEHVVLGSQDIHFTEDGSYTGAPISPQDLRSLGLNHTLVGHSETVVYFGVKDADVAKKLDAALRAGIHVTVCLGVMPDIEAAGKGKEALAQQVRDRIVAALKDEHRIGAPNFDIAWEPVAAIKGFADLWGLPPVPPRDEDIVDAHAVVRQALNDAGYQNYADAVAVSYGGSVNEKNAEHLLRLKGVDGLLIGTAAWNLEKLIEIVRIAERLA